MKMYCPFCKNGVVFDKSEEYETTDCPTCDHLIRLKHLSCWGELKYDFNQLWKSIDEWTRKHIVGLSITAAICVLIGGFTTWPYPTLIFIGSVAAIVGLTFLIVQPSFWFIFGKILWYAFIVAAIIFCFASGLWVLVLLWMLFSACCKSSPQTTTTQTINGNNNTQTNQTANGNNNFNTYNFTFHSNTPPKIVKCAHCGSPRPESLSNCPGCGSSSKA